MKRRACQGFSRRSRLFQGTLALCAALTLITISHRGNAAAATFNGSGFTIADNGTVATRTISVSGLSGGITSVSITLTFSPAPRLDDLDLLLVHPNATNNLEFMSDAGGTSSFTGTITLAGGGAICIPNNGPLVNGATYRPADYSTSEPASDWGLSITIFRAGSGCPSANGSVTFAQAFNGLPPNGTWTLYARDDTTSGTGTTVTGWSITITTTSPPTVADVESFTATSGADGRTALRWRTGYEVDNLGFRLYRDQGGQRVLLTPSLVAGSALLAGSGTELTAGRSYAWWDDSLPGTDDVLYWLEDIDLSGRSTWHGPVAIDLSVSPDLSHSTGDRQAPLLSDLGRTVARQTPTQPLKRYARRTAPPAVPSAQQALLAAHPAVKLSVRQEGLYRVTQPELVAAGLNAGVDPRRLQL